MKFGAHLSIAKGLQETAKTAVKLGCETFQIFSRSPRGGKARQFSQEELAAFKKILGEARISPVVVHVPYLINLAAAEEQLYKYGQEVLEEDLLRTKLLGAPYLVTHIGSYRGDKRLGLKLVADAIRNVLERVDTEVMLLLENTAGVGSELGTTFEEISQVITETGHEGQLGLCLDTCHAFAAGYDLRSDSGITQLIREIESSIGLEFLKVVHINDSKHGLGSHKDRHEHIGQGLIGIDGFKQLLSRSELGQLPFILETPVDSPDADARNLGILKQLRGELSQA